MCSWWFAMAGCCAQVLVAAQPELPVGSEPWMELSNNSGWNMLLQSLETPFCCWFMLVHVGSTLEKNFLLFLLVALNPRQALSVCPAGSGLSYSAALNSASAKIHCSWTPVGTDKQCWVPLLLASAKWMVYIAQATGMCWLPCVWHWDQLRAHYTRMLDTHARRYAHA